MKTSENWVAPVSSSEAQWNLVPCRAIVDFFEKLLLNVGFRSEVSRTWLARVFWRGWLGSLKATKWRPAMRDEAARGSGCPRRAPRYAAPINNPSARKQAPKNAASWWLSVTLRSFRFVSVTPIGYSLTNRFSRFPFSPFSILPPPHTHTVMGLLGFTGFFYFLQPPFATVMG